MSRIFIRIAPESNISIAKNYEFIGKELLYISLCPIPEIVGEVNCDCGQPATVIFNDELYKCNTCTKYLIPENKLESNDDLSYPITIQTIKEMRFEFSYNGEKWYNLWGRNIETKEWKGFLKEIKAMALEKKEIEINGEYTQETKKMQIY